jgi:hypothetical protein
MSLPYIKTFQVMDEFGRESRKKKPEQVTVLMSFGGILSFFHNPCVLILKFVHMLDE